MWSYYFYSHEYCEAAIKFPCLPPTSPLLSSRPRQRQPQHPQNRACKGWLKPVKETILFPLFSPSHSLDFLVSLNSEVQVYVHYRDYPSFSVHGQVSSSGKIEIPSMLAPLASSHIIEGSRSTNDFNVYETNRILYVNYMSIYKKSELWDGGRKLGMKLQERSEQG